jgi:hypothetical protein
MRVLHNTFSNCLGLEVGYLLTKGCCCGFVPYVRDAWCVVVRVLRREILFGTCFHFPWLVDKLWWNEPQWRTPCSSEKPMVCEAQCLMIFNFFCCRLGLLSCVETSPQFYCFGVAISVDVKSVDSRPSPLWIYFHFLWQFVYGHIQFFSLCSCSWTCFTQKNKFHRECPFFFAFLHYHVKINILYSTRKKKDQPWTCKLLVLHME